jgi:endonuclease V-like protein UPF0215 family
LGVDDGVFVPGSKGFALVVGVVFRGGYWLDGVMHTRVKVDGFNARRKIAAMILGSPHHEQLRVVMLNGITFAGFNVVDIRKLNQETGLPVVAVTRDRPDFVKIKEALKNLSRSEDRWKAVQSGGEIFPVRTRKESEKVYVQASGISREDTEKVLQITSTRSSVPEALRVAHLVASGVSCV